jgi:hypothetical protein
MNLIINAAEAIPASESGSVLVTCGDTSRGQFLSQDPFALTGSRAGGIRIPRSARYRSEDDSETQARIFDPFFTTKVKGRGLGLAAVLGIIQSHKGSIKVYSQPGTGTTFKVLFPALAGEKAKHNSVREDLRGRGVILVIDDEDVVRRVAKAALEMYGYSVIGAEDGERAFACSSNVRKK